MQNSKHIYGLDAARLLLIGGPIIHSVFENHKTFPLQMVMTTSSLFRMASFFAIAGFVVAINRKAREASWLIHRARQLIVPLVTMMIVMALVHMWVVRYHPNNHQWGNMLPLHLWFLICLIIFTPITLIMDKTSLSGMFNRWVDKTPLMIFIITGGMLGAVLVLEWFFYHGSLKAFAQSAWGETLINLPLKNFPFYLLGFLLGRNFNAVKALNNNAIIGAGFTLFVGSLVFYGHFLDQINAVHPPVVIKLIWIGLSQITPLVMSLCVLMLALRITKVGPVVMYLSGASYSVYLLHFAFIFLVGYTVVDAVPSINPYLLWGITTISCLTLSLLGYEIIRRSAFLSFLFNGKAYPMKFHFTTPKTPRCRITWRKTFVFMARVMVSDRTNRAADPQLETIFMKSMETRVTRKGQRLWQHVDPSSSHNLKFIDLSDKILDSSELPTMKAVQS